MNCRLVLPITSEISRTKPKLSVGLGLLLFFILLFGGFPPTESQAEQGYPVILSEIAQDEQLAGFETHLETIRQALKIPGMSAAVVQNQELIWAAGFGFADLENQVAATPDTPYGLASVTKPVAAVLIMQLVEQGLVDLDAPLTQYGVNMDNQAITVRHLLTHTSEGVLGTVHNYNGSRYARLGGVMEGAAKQTFAALLSQRVLLPLEMRNTALNPVNNWGGSLLAGVEDFERALGWGADFRHYPDVYARLAKPYQFDREYNLIPGMYQLYHNPGAGLISSVTDLAKFDIALDQGLLLGGAAQAEMFTPAYSTYNNQRDLMYGLGWYIQDFEGLQLRWHTGRWAPSTSALYLKIPEEHLTFIVLANTDNLTVPFYSVGCCGDISKSILALSFFRHFIYPKQQEAKLPAIDWEANQAELVAQLAEVEDPAAREFLERELWSFRQVYASVGRDDQVEKLRRVSIHAFPGSGFRNDELFTNLPGQYPVIPPSVPATVYVWISWGLAIWFLFTFIAMVWMTLRLLGTNHIFKWDGFIWLLATLFLGPISLGIHVLTHPTAEEKPLSQWRQAWAASTMNISGYTLAWVLAITLLKNLGKDPHPLMTLAATYLTPLLVGLFFIRVPLLAKQMKIGWGKCISRCVLSEIITINLGFSVLFPLTLLLSERLFTTIPQPSSPFFWGMIAFIAGVGLIILAPLQYWMIRQGYALPSGLAINDLNKLRLPKLRTTWPVLFTTSAVMVVALAVTIGQLG